jgi:hypothetical protein
MADRDEARARAEATFKKPEQQPKESEKVRDEHTAAGKVADKNRAKLKEQRLAKEAADKADPAPGKAKASKTTTHVKAKGYLK